MKARVIKYADEFGVEIVHANQGFRLDYEGSREECRWMVRMFTIALRAHNQEFLDKLLPRARAARAKERSRSTT